MAMPQTQIIQDQPTAADMAEVKQRAQYYVVDESLSEWELARQTSKTWSMEQE